jgi:glycosyltransferase involved in cell wall biosynthesis
MTDSLISIILPTYNRASVIKRAVMSILDQAYTDFELLIIDDGSIDDTADVVGGINDERIRYIKNDTNQGQTIARNIGLKEVSGKYIAFLDSDDEWDKNYLKRQQSILKQQSNEYGLVYCKCKRMNGDSVSFIPKELIREDEVKSRLLAENFMTLQGVLLKKGYLDKCGLLDEEMPALEDWDFFIRLADICKFKYNDEVLVTMHASIDGANNNITNRIKAREHILGKYKSDMKAYHQVLNNHYYILTMENVFIGNKQKAIEFFKKYLELSQKRPADYFALFLLRLNINLAKLYFKLNIRMRNIFK